MQLTLDSTGYTAHYLRCRD